MEKYQNAKYVFVVGIGGSDLASKAIWNAMTLHKLNVNKKIFFLESPDVREYEEIENLVDSGIFNAEEIVLIIISKSGETTETIQTFNKIFQILTSKFGESVSDRTILISTEESSLWKIGEERKVEFISWQGDVGGRFSAFTTPHTTILSIAGLNAYDFVEGGKEMAKKCEDENSKATNLAQNIFDNYKREIKILDFFIFNSELEDLGKWCRQLIAESISLITPTVSIGPVDLHSMLELYLGGPKSRFTIFIRSFKEIDGGVNEMAYKNVTATYKKATLPFEKYEMPEISERELGKFMAFMIEMTLDLAELLSINPYDQPAVENYKKSIKI